MIDTIKLEQFQNIANCKTDQQFSRESFLSITYQFQKGNVYGLVSDFGCGSWGLSTCLGGRGDGIDNGKILLNNQVCICVLDLKNRCGMSDIFVYDNESAITSKFYQTIKRFYPVFFFLSNIIF